MNRLFSPENGFAVCQLAALALTGATVIGFFAGGLNFGKWDGVQWFYGAVGLAIAFGLTAFTATAYRSRKGLMMLAAATIGISLEVAQTLERSTAMRQSRSEQSAVYQAAVAALPAGAVSVPETGELAQAKARLSAIPRREDTRAVRRQAQAEVSRLTEARKLKLDEAKDAEGRAWIRVQSLQHDDSHAHAAVRLLMDWQGISFERASALFGVWIVAALHVAFYALGSAASQPLLEAERTRSMRVRQLFQGFSTWLSPPKHSAQQMTHSADSKSDFADVAEQQTTVFTPCVNEEIAPQESEPDAVQGSNELSGAKEAAALLEWMQKRGMATVTLRQIISSGPHRQGVSLRNSESAILATNTLINGGMAMMNGENFCLKM